MKKFMPIYFVYIFLLFVSTLDAMKFSDKGLYGNLGYIYSEDVYSDSRNVNSQEKFMQEYKLGYKGNIYSPKLLGYTLETTFRYENLVNKNSDLGSESKVKSQDYSVKANFIKSTKIPFRLYYRTLDRPTSYIYGNTVSKYTQDLESKGLSGSIDFGLFRLLYSTDFTNAIFETVTSVQHRKTEKSELSISKVETNYNLKLTYNHLNQSTKTDVLDISSKTISEVYDRAGITYLWKISDSLRLNTNVSYLDSKSLLSESIYANAHLTWSPKTDYSASISANTTLINQTTKDVNEFGVTSKNQDTITTSGMGQSFSYRITKNLNFTEALSYIKYNSISSSGENTSLNLGLNYGLKLGETTMGRLSASVSGRDSKLTVDTDDLNESIKGEQSYAYNIHAGLNKQFVSGDSRLNLSLKHSGTQSSQNRNNDNTMLNLSLTSKFWISFNNNLVINYSIDNSNYAVDGGTSTVSRISLSDSLSYNSRIGIKGNVSAVLSANYSLINNNGNELTRIVPKLNIGLNYRFWQRLMYNLNLGLYKDLSYDFINYYANTSLRYEIGKTSLSMSYNYNMNGIDNGVEVSSIEKSKFEAKIMRRF